MGVDENPTATVVDGRHEPTHGCGDDRCAACLRLQRDEPERFVVAGHAHEIARGEHFGQGIAVPGWHEMNRVRKPQLLDEVVQTLRVLRC